MRFLKDHVSHMVTKVGSFRKALGSLLDDDVTMTYMNLSKFRYDSDITADLSCYAGSINS
jgi:hypothetical protein